MDGRPWRSRQDRTRLTGRLVRPIRSALPTHVEHGRPRARDCAVERTKGSGPDPAVREGRWRQRVTGGPVMTRRAAVQRAVIEHLIVGDDPQAWRLAWVLTEDLYGTPV